MRVDDENRELSEPAQRLVNLACQELGEMSARRRAAGFLELNARRSPAVRRTRFALGLAAALTAIALVLIGRPWLPGSQRVSPLSYTVQAGRIGPHGSLESNGATEPVLRFSDGSKVVFLGGARGQLKAVEEHGARIGVVGKVDVAVVHSQASRWLFDAGPFLITVTGTAFTAEWRAAEERLEISLRAGSVSVTGPLPDKAVTLRAGQRLIISKREKEVLIRDLNSTEASIAPSALRSRSEASISPPQSVPSAVAPGLPSTNRAGASWASQLAAGQFSAILQQAEQRGLDAVLADTSSSDLAALADAARYSRRDDVARRALTAQRSRFPRSARANDAAFLLGRLEEAARHAELALTWYERCLAESPHGTYVSEALGRKMTLVERLHGAARARPIAEEYLRRFANGTYAAAARALTRAP